jgi:hypothetical protein
MPCPAEQVFRHSWHAGGLTREYVQNNAQKINPSLMSIKQQTTVLLKCMFVVDENGTVGVTLRWAVITEG